MRISNSLLAALLCLCLAGPAAAAEGKAALGDQISGRINLTPEERQAIEPLLAHYYALDGTAETLQSVLEIVAGTGCRGDCMADMLGMVNKVMRSGLPCSLAGREVALTLTAVKTRCDERGIPPTGPELSRATRSVIEGKYREKNGGMPATPSPTSPTSRNP